MRLSLLALTIVSISRVHGEFPLLARIRPALVAAALALGFAILKPHLVNMKAALRTWPPKVMIGLALVACGSVLFGISSGAAGSFVLESYWKSFVYAFLMFGILNNVRDLRLFVWAFVACAGVLVWMSLFIYDVQLNPATGSTRINGLVTYDGNEGATVLVTALPLTVLAFITSGRTGKLICGAVILGIAMSLARLGSRGSFVALALVGAMLLLGLPVVSAGKRVAALAVVVVGLTLAAPPGYWTRMTSLLSPTEDYNWSSVDGRRQLAMRGMGYMLRYPMFGVGISNFPRAEGTLSGKARNPVTGEGVWWATAHNSYVQVGAEMGVPGLMLWSSVIVGGLVGIRRLRKRLPRAWLRGTRDQRFLYLSTHLIPVALAGFGAGAFFVSFAYADVFFFLTALVGGVYLSAADATRLMVSGRRPAARPVG